ncbi:MAG: hypothetical protein ACMUJM_08780 [bacterium]
MNFFKKIPLLITLTVILVSFYPCSSMRAQQSSPRFTGTLQWNQYIEISETKKEMTASNFELSLGFSSPQTLELYFSLGLEELDFTDESGVNKNLEPALSWKIGGILYILKNLQVGIPLDFSISLDYLMAVHDEEELSNRKYTHKRILCTGDFYWYYSQVSPYIKFGLARSELDTPSDERDVAEKLSLIFTGGIKFPMIQNLLGKIEANMYKDLGFCLGLEHHF